MTDEGSKTRRAIRVPIWAKLALFAGSLAVAATLSLGFVLTEVSANTVKVTSRDYRLALAEDVAETVRTSLRQSRVDLLTSAEILAAGATDPDATLRWLLALVSASSTLDHLVVYGPDGGRIDAVAEPGLAAGGAERLEPALLAKLATTREVVTGGIVRGDDGPRLELHAAIRPIEGAPPSGYVSTRAALSDVESRVREVSGRRLSAPGSRMFVVDSARQVLATSTDGVDLGVADHPLLENPDVLMTKRVAQSGEVATTDGPKVASVLPLPDLDWFVVVEVPRDVAYASLTTMRQRIWLAVLIVLVIALIASAAGSRRIAGPLKQLTAFADKIARRVFDERVDVRSADELGVLADGMNDAAQQLADSEEQIRQEAAIRADLGRYLPHELVEAVVRREQSLELGGVRAPITVLFADIVRFTPLCESLPPERIVALLNEFFTITTEIIFRHGGTVDKFVGDSVMAFWGAPTPCDDHADRALRAAEDMLRWLEVGNDEWVERFGVSVEVAIGVNTGSPIVGNIGSSTRMEYTVIGEAVNTAARLEALARPGQILTTAATRAASREYDFTLVAEEVIHTESESIAVWEVLV